ncbi:MAG: 5-oxoprolinase subunit PxpB, partial [Verrucomicrobia subdivision 3 bacterium]|nr:5-oxoprolinase subunit PxpB [Limisphaerales bacterium]
ADLERDPPAGLREFVPAFTTVLLVFEPDCRLQEIAPQLLQRFKESATKPIPARKPVEIPVKYDGPDLDRVAELHSLGREQVIALHSAPVYKVYMLGFSPGFPYLGELDQRLHTPRLSSPRPRVPRGSVAIGGAHTGIYSVESPGGWNIIGHTSTTIFDPSRDRAEVFLLRQGDQVRFLPI